MIREWIASLLRAIGATSTEFRTETVDRFPLPVWSVGIYNKSGTRLVGNRVVEARTPHAAMLACRESVSHGLIVEVDGLRWRLRDNALPVLIDRAARNHAGDRKRHRKETI